MKTHETEPLLSSKSNHNDDSNKISINFKKLDGSMFNLLCEGTITVLDLKLMIQKLQDIPQNKQRLIYRARELKIPFLMSDYGIKNGSTVHLVIRKHVFIDTIPETSNIATSGDPPQSAADGYSTAYSTADDRNINENIINNQSNVDTVDVMEIVRTCRFVRIFAIIDAAIMLIDALFSTSDYGWNWFVISCLCIAFCACAFGYYGAKIVNKICIFGYALSLIFEFCLRGYEIYLQQNNIYDVIGTTCGILVVIIIFVYVVQLLKVIPTIPNQEMERIRSANSTGFF